MVSMSVILWFFFVFIFLIFCFLRCMNGIVLIDIYWKWFLFEWIVIIYYIKYINICLKYGGD